MKINPAVAPLPRILAVTDGRAGNMRQATALAQAVARRVGAVARHVATAPRRPFHLLPPALTPMAAAPVLFAPPPPCEMVIGCGRRVAPLVAWMRATGRARAVQILDPQMRLDAFDLVIAPRHDRLKGGNLIEILGGLNDLDPAHLAAQAAPWRDRLAHLPQPRVAVLVGGPSRRAKFGAIARAALCDGLGALAAQGAGLMITPSRRTPPALIAALRATGGWVWDGAGDNPYPGILGLADAVVVTADSVNMASEAAATGLPVFVSAVDGLSDKHQRFHAALSAHGATRPFDGGLAQWRYPPLAETARAAERAAALLA